MLDVLVPVGAASLVALPAVTAFWLSDHPVVGFVRWAMIPINFVVAAYIIAVWFSPDQANVVAALAAAAALIVAAARVALSYIDRVADEGARHALERAPPDEA